MIWEQKLTAIIMLTETVEAGRVCLNVYRPLLHSPYNRRSAFNTGQH